MDNLLNELNIEKSVLRVKIKELTTYIQEEGFIGSVNEELSLLLTQLNIMQSYFNLLELRAKLLEKR